MSDARSPLYVPAASARRRGLSPSQPPNLLASTLAAVVATALPFAGLQLETPARQHIQATPPSGAITLEDAAFVLPIPGWTASAPDIWTRHVYPVAQPPNLQELLNYVEPMPAGRTYQIPPADYRRLWLPARSFFEPPWRIPFDQVAFAGTVPAQTGVEGSAFSLSLASYFSGDLTPFAYSVASGALPTGLSLGAATGVVSGTLTADGIFTAVIRATDLGTYTADTGTITFTITALPSAPGYADVPHVELAYKTPASSTSRVFDFISLLEGVAISSASVECSVHYGIDTTPANVLGGSPTVAGSRVTVPLDGGVSGNIYFLLVTVVTEDDDVLYLGGLLPVVTRS